MNNSPFNLNGKTILITGASSGIGRSIAIECSKMGAHLIITGRDPVRLNETFSTLAGENHILIVGDLTLEDDIHNLISYIDRLDGLVLCAGKGILSPLPFSSKRKLEDIFNVNLFSPIELVRNIVKTKRINNKCSIIAISSMAGTNFYTIGNGIYGASKAALDSYMKFIARELAPKGIRVNTILPAMIETPFIHNGVVSDESLTSDSLNYPLRRFGKPEDVAYAAIYLLSDASAWVTGTSLIIDGGKSLV